MIVNELTNHYRGTGIIAADPELRDVGEKQVCNLRLAVPGLAGREEAFGFLDLAVWGAPGVACHAHLARRMTITFCGALDYQAYERKDETTGYALRIASATVQFPARPPRDGEDPLLDDRRDPGATDEPVPVGEEAIPF